MKTSRLLTISLLVALALGLVNVFLTMAKYTGASKTFTQEMVLADNLEPDLSLSEITAPTKVASGERITYTISILNTGGVAESTVLSDVLPLGTTLISGSLSCTSGSCFYDANTQSIRWNGVLSSTQITQTRYYATAVNDGKVVYVLDLIKAGWWETNAWGTVMTFTVPLLSDNMGIDYDSEHEVLYHTDFYSDVIVVTDLLGNYLFDFRCPSPSGFNSGVTYLEGSNPPEAWVTDFSSNQTTRCEVKETPPNRLAPTNVIETFTNTWAISTFGLAYNPIENLIRYAHQGQATNSAEIWDIAIDIPHTPLFNTSLSSVNPGWLSQLDDRNGVDFDAATGTYFLPDYNGNLADHDDNLIEITPEGIILNAWEFDGPEKDSYDNSQIDEMIDIAIIPTEAVFISFAVQVDAAYAEVITHTASLYDPAMSTPITLTASTEIVDTMYEYWDFETSDGGFASAPNDGWQWGVPSRGNDFGPRDAHSGVKVWGTTLSGVAAASVLTPTLMVTTTLAADPNGLYLQWWDWMGAQNGDSRSILINDVEIWNDDGEGNQSFWKHHILDISTYAGMTVTIQFRLNTCCTPLGPSNWYIDDVALHSKLAPPDVSTTGNPSIHLPPNQTGIVPIEIHNSGGLGVIWSASEDIPWLSENPTSGIVGKAGTQTVGFLFDSKGLALGTYTGMVSIATNDEDTPIIFVNVTLNVVNYGLYLPIIYK